MTATEIRAIETHYRGYRFRSRLEARWAVFFDALGFDWDYEPQGYVLLDGSYYLPDFYVRTIDRWIEIKPPLDAWPKHRVWDAMPDPYDDQERTPDEEAMIRFGLRFVLLAGEPYADPAGSKYCGYVHADEGHLFCECPRCGKIGIQFEARAGRLCDCFDTDRGHNGLSPNLVRAYQAARGARFEHGETPNVPTPQAPKRPHPIADRLWELKRMLFNARTEDEKSAILKEISKIHQQRGRYA
jgi:hypothetical protein